MHRYTLMKSEPTKPGNGAATSRAYEQKEVARYTVFDEAVAACGEANRKRPERFYVMNDAGKEYYADTWID